MPIAKLLLAASFTMFIGLQASSQSTQTDPKNKNVKLTPKFGQFADSTKLSLANAKTILKSALRVRDPKMAQFTIVEFDFAWRQREVVNDPRTGKPNVLHSYNATTVKGDSTIPAPWQKELSANLTADEELLFDNILAQDPKTKKIYKVPSLRLLVKE